MAYQGRGGGSGNVLRPTQDEGYANIYRDYLKSQDEAMRLGNLGQEIADRNMMSQQNQEAQGIQNILRGAEVPYASDAARLKNEMMQAQIRQMQERNMYGDLTGEVGNALKIAMLEKQLGPNDPRVMAAKEQLMLQQESQRQRNAYTQQLSEQAPKRNATSQGKLLQELAEVNAGFRPGSDYRQPLSPEEQAMLRGQYELALLNKNTDTNTRTRTLLASNIDKTLESFDVKDLVRYAGPAGTIAKKIEQGKALSGKESEEFAKYEEALTSVDLLASQIRQFYGDSVTASMRKHLEEITNPATWANNPRLAERKFNQLKEILHAETSTYRNALKGTSEFAERAPERREIKMITIRNPRTGEVRQVTEEEAISLGARRK